MSHSPPYPPQYDGPPTVAYAGPMPDADNDHLRLLAIFHWIVGPIQLLMGCFPLIHLAIGIAIVSGAFQSSRSAAGPSVAQSSSDQFVGWFFIAFSLVFIIACWTIGGLTLFSGFQIKNRRRRTFSIVIAGVNCVFFPFGTALGVFTLIVLLRRSVEALYRSAAR